MQFGLVELQTHHALILAFLFFFRHMISYEFASIRSLHFAEITLSGIRGIILLPLKSMEAPLKRSSPNSSFQQVGN
jgi:hypothetical protein